MPEVDGVQCRWSGALARTCRHFRNCCSISVRLPDRPGVNKKFNLKLFCNCMTASGVVTDAHEAMVRAFIKSASIELDETIPHKVILRVYAYGLDPSCNVDALKQALVTHPELELKAMRLDRMHFHYRPRRQAAVSPSCTLSMTYKNRWVSQMGSAPEIDQRHQPVERTCIRLLSEITQATSRSGHGYGGRKDSGQYAVHIHLDPLPVE